MYIKIEVKKNRRPHQQLITGIILGTGLCVSSILQAQTLSPGINNSSIGNSPSTSNASASNVSDSLSQSNAQSGVGTANATSSGGQGIAAGGSSTVVTEVNQNFESSRNPGSPDGIAPLVSSPALFRPPEGTLPGTAASILASMAYIDTCGISLGGTPTKEVRSNGSSGNTEVTFLPHQNYLDRQKQPHPSMVAKETEKKSDKDKAKQKKKKYTPPAVDIVAIKFPKQAVKGECLGMLSVQSREKRADETYFFTLLNDAMGFAKNKLRGSANIDLLCGYRTIATSVGVANGGIAGSISPGLSNLTSANLFQGLLAGITGSSARTFPHSQLGMTCIVTGKGTDSIDISMLNRGGMKYDPAAIGDAIDRQEQQAIERSQNGNRVKEKAAVEHETRIEPAKQKAQGTGG